MELRRSRSLARTARTAWAVVLLSSPRYAEAQRPSAAGGSAQPSASAAATAAGAQSAAAEAQRLFDANDMKGALPRFQQAYELSHDRTLLVKIAACYKNLGMFTRALEAAQAYLDSATSDSDRARAREFVEGLAELTSPLWVESNEPGARVTIDTNQVGLTPMQKPVLVDIGVQQIRVTKPGFSPGLATVRAPGFGREVRVRVELTRERHDGTLSVVAAPGQSVWIDGKVVARGRWEGVLTAGPHAVRVTAPEMKDYEEQVTVVDGRQTDVRVRLVPASTAPPAAEESSGPSWLLLAGVGLGAAVLTTGAIVGGYYLFKSDGHEPEPPAAGSAGDIQVGLVLGGVR
ncbi:MAG: PEGA domain-containing protein [Polyangiaceae bacterium]|nr:PEGA domain-containing protein [Polyangiaceae bacterium]